MKTIIFSPIIIGISLCLTLLAVFISLSTNAQITFEKTYGDIYFDRGYSVQQTNDGGYIITGSFADSNSIYFSIISNVYLIKTNSLGDTLWTKTYGGKLCSEGYSVQQTNDGGYIIAGMTNYCVIDSPTIDVFLIKTNSLGDTLWTKTYGDTYDDIGYSVQQTSDDGYIITGSTFSFGAGLEDVYLIKTNANGDTIWTKTYGGTSHDYGRSVQQTTDGGYIIAGNTTSFGAGGIDVYLIKTNANGDTIWTKTYSGTDWDESRSVQQTSDSGYIIAGLTKNFGGAIFVYLIKTNTNGDTLWTKTYGGSESDAGYSVQQTSDNGYIITGYTYSFGAEMGDVYLIKTNENGDTLWTKTYGGIYNEKGWSVQQTSDGGYIIAGGTVILASWDVYLIKTDINGNVSGIFNNSFSKKDVINIYPNPNNGVFNLTVNTPDKCNLFIELMNVYGQIVYKNYVKNILKFNDEIEVSELSKGVYYLRLKTENGIRVKKLIIQ